MKWEEHRESPPLTEELDSCGFQGRKSRFSLRALPLDVDHAPGHGPASRSIQAAQIELLRRVRYDYVCLS